MHVIGSSLERLDEMGELARALISGQPGVGLLIVDTQLRVRRIDGDEFHDFDPEDVVGRSVEDVVPAGAWEVLRPRYLGALRGEAQSFEYAAVSRPSVYWIRMAPTRDGGEVTGVLVLCEDISSKLSGNGRLAGSEPLERAVIESLDEGVVVIDLRGRLMQANAAACEILGVDFETARDDPSWWRPLAVRRRGVGPSLEQISVGTVVLASGRAIRDVDVAVTRRDGTSASLLVNYLPLREKADLINGMVVSFRDVTERERDYRRLVETQERLREAHEVARLSSWEWRPESDEVIIFHALAEDATLRGTHASLDDLFGPMSADERQDARGDLAALVRGEREESVRCYCRHDPTGPVWLEMRSRAVRDRHGRLVFVRGTNQDVTEQERAKRELAGSRDFFQGSLDSLPAHIAVLDEHGEILMTNRAWDTFASANDGTPAEIGANYLDVCDAAREDELASQAGAALRAIIAGTRTDFKMDYPCHSPTIERWFVLRAARYEQPGPARVVVSHYDITTRRQAQDLVATQAALLDEVDVSVIATDPQGRVTHWNRGAERLYGWARAEAVGRSAGELIVAADARRAEEVAGELRRDGHWEGEFVVCRKDGSTFPAFVRDRLMVDGRGRPAGMIGVSVDMTERVASERALLSARNYLGAVADSMGEGLITLDPEGRVIYVNEAAEKLLGWPAEELQGRMMHDVTHSRRPDGTQLPIEDCPILHARRDGVPVRVEDDVFICRDGRSLPVAYTAAPFVTEDGVEGCAVVFEDITERQAREENLERDAETLSWIGRVQEALAQDRFLLYAQPIIDVRSGKVVQRELLLRMREPSGKIVGPGSYLHIAEQYGLIGDIDRWVIGRATEIAATGCRVELNLSARTVGDPTVLDHIERCLEQTGADPTGLVFEITETALVTDQAAAKAFADRLHALGCKLALDDFGTGYGGFTYLKQFPVDFLKIDIEFVRDLPTNPASRHVVESVVALARAFGLQTVAEGVEDARALELLLELGVDFAQGYYIATPGPLDQTLAPVDLVVEGQEQ